MSRSLCLAALLLGFCVAPLFAGTALPTPNGAGANPSLRSFLEHNCFECHDDTTQKGNLQLDNLSTDFSKLDVERTWIEVFDKLSSGQMPPKKKPRPPEDQVKGVLAYLKNGLTAADLARRNASGRVVLRRLNRNEYQNTIRDLLHVDIDVKDLLPEDTASMGFDNVAAALSVSSVLMDRYLEAADAAVDAAVQTGPRPEQKTWDVDYGVVTKNPDDYRLKSGNRTLDDGTFVIFNSGDVPVVCDRFKAPATGQYHIRFTAYAYQSKEPLTISILSGSFDPRTPKRRTIGYFDIQPDKPRTIEFTDTLPKNGTFKVMVHRIGRHYFPDATKWKTFDGPGAAIGKVQAEGPLNDAWPPLSYTALFGELDLAKATAADVEPVLSNFARRAFRRPVESAEVAPYVALVKAQLDAGQPFAEAIRVGLKAILCSPEFLFLREQPGKLDDYAVASRLSYFLWSSMPDEQLLGLAARHALTTPAVLQQQTERMLRDSKAAAFTEDFTGQWLLLRQIDFTVPDRKLYPEFDDMLEWSMVQETHRFFDEVLSHDLSLTNFIDSDFGMINGPVAEQYGIPNVSGIDIRKVPLPPGCHRGGVLAQAAVLKVTANGTNTSPVIRGAWVMRNILGHPPKAPPPNLPAIEPDIRGATTIREQLARHRTQATCNACHANIDPPGCALESFDVIGGWRENYRSLGAGKSTKIMVEGHPVGIRLGPKVDPSATFPDGRSFENFDQFKQILLQRKDEVARCLAEKLLVYSTGAAIDFADHPAVDRILQQTREHGDRFRTLIEQVVQSDVFLNK